MFANDSEDQSLIPGRVIPKYQKIVLDTFLLKYQYYKVRIKCKVEKSRGRSSALPFILEVKILKKKPSGCSRLRSPTLPKPICRVFAIDSGDQSLIPYQKIVLDTSLLNSQHYKVRIKGKVKQNVIK